jgi:precorrin-6A synthase
MVVPGWRRDDTGAVSEVDAVAPSRSVLVIGVGSGDPSLVTAQAADALATLDVVVTITKGERADELVDLRRTVLDRFAGGGAPRVIEIAEEPRPSSVSYEEAVRVWHDRRMQAMERALVEEVAADETAGLLVWGDPAWYDSTLRLLDEVNGRGRVQVDHSVVPGVSSLELLAARHRVPLNQIGGSVLVTTGRRLREGVPDGIDDVVVMLDGEMSFRSLQGRDFEIFWGAYLGMPDEILVAGDLDEVAEEIARRRAEARERKGWVFDIYLVRRKR